LVSAQNNAPLSPSFSVPLIRYARDISPLQKMSDQAKEATLMK